MRGTGGGSRPVRLNRWLAMALIAPTLCGCDSTPQATPAAKAVDPSAKGTAATQLENESGEPSTEQAELWAAEIDKQTDAFRALQQERRAMLAKPDAAEGDATHATPRQSRRRPAIDWAGEVPPADTLEPVPNATATLSPIGPAVARDQPETLQVKPPPARVDELRQKLVNLRRDLYRESIDSEQPIRELLAIAAMSIIDPDLELPDDRHRELTPAELEMLEELHVFFAELGRSLGDETEAHETILAAVAELQHALSDEPTLDLPTTSLCWRVGGFGDFDEFDPYAFLAHEEQPVILYLELDGFESEQNRKGDWVTILAQQLEIYSDRDGIPVWSDPWQKVSDLTSKRRRDFFTTQMITLPSALSVGRYHLKIRVRDEKSGAVAERSVPFEMVADPRLAATVGP